MVFFSTFFFEGEEEVILEPWQEIYAKNRREVAIQHRRFDSLHLTKTESGLCKKGILPQYNQPEDSYRIKKLITRMKAFRPKLPLEIFFIEKSLNLLQHYILYNLHKNCKIFLKIAKFPNIGENLKMFNSCSKISKLLQIM